MELQRAFEIIRECGRQYKGNADEHDNIREATQVVFLALNEFNEIKSKELQTKEQLDAAKV